MCVYARAKATEGLDLTQKYTQKSLFARIKFHLNIVVVSK